MIEFTQVLCPIDFSDTSLRALRYAAAIAGWYSARLEVLHVVPVFDYQATLPGVETVPVIPGGREFSRDAVVFALGHAVEAASASDLGPALTAEAGRVPDTIVERARSQRADLIVMGTHGRSGFNRLLLGSATERVLRVAPCPVLTVPSAATPPLPPRFARILCPIDFSPSAGRALRYALELGRQAGGRVTMLYALEYMDAPVACRDDPDYLQARERFLADARQRLHAQVAQEPTTWCEIEEVVVVDRAYKAILQRAASEPVDLIVMGAQGAGGLELILYGSNTQHVLRAAPCPVLTVHA